MSSFRVLVVGATGKQGGAVVKALLALPARQPPLRILALTRDKTTARAKALEEAHKGVLELVQGDAATPKPIFEAIPKGSVNALFSVTTPGKIPEEQQAIPLIDTAVEHGVSHIVFSSVERGGDERSWTNPTDVPHFEAKMNIEVHLRDKAAKEGGKLTYTILRPVAFLDNLSPGFFGKVMPAMMEATMAPDKKLQMVSVHDIGLFAAAALVDPSRWPNKAIGLAGDELTLGEIRETYKKVTGGDLPQTFWLLARGVLMIKDVGNMFRWFQSEGYAADIAARKREIPTQDFETFLRESGKFSVKA